MTGSNTLLQRLVQPFRFLAGMLGLVGLGGIAIRLQSSVPVDVSFGVGMVSVASLLGFAFLPRALWDRYWLLAGLLACIGLGFAAFQLEALVSGSLDRVLLSGHVLLAGVFGVMLVDALYGRWR